MMALRRCAPLALCVVLTAAAQQNTAPPPSPEIRGLVLDPDTKQPVAGAEVSLYFIGEEQPRVMTGLGMMQAEKNAVTGFSGEFDFHLDKPGYYAVAAKKEGYNSPGNAAGNQRFTITSGDPVKEARLYLAKPGRITGIVTDEETGKPVAGIRVVARRPRVGGTQFFGAIGGATERPGRMARSPYRICPAAHTWWGSAGRRTTSSGAIVSGGGVGAVLPRGVTFLPLALLLRQEGIERIATEPATSSARVSGMPVFPPRTRWQPSLAGVGRPLASRRELFRQKLPPSRPSRRWMGCSDLHR